MTDGSVIVFPTMSGMRNGCSAYMRRWARSIRSTIWSHVPSSGSGVYRCTSRPRISSTISSRPVMWLYNDDGVTPSRRAIALTPNGAPSSTSSIAASAMRSVDSSGVLGLGIGASFVHVSLRVAKLPLPESGSRLHNKRILFVYLVHTVVPNPRRSPVSHPLPSVRIPLRLPSAVATFGIGIAGYLGVNLSPYMIAAAQSALAVDVLTASWLITGTLLLTAVSGLATAKLSAGQHRLLVARVGLVIAAVGFGAAALVPAPGVVVAGLLLGGIGAGGAVSASGAALAAFINPD